MKYTDKQKAALRAKGYTLRGNTFYNKEGQAAGSINSKGMVNSSDSFVRKVLSQKQAKATPKATPKRSQSLAPTKSKRPVARKPKTTALEAPPKVTVSKLSNVKGGRGNGVAEIARRALDKTPTKPVTNKPEEGPKSNKPGTPLGSLFGISEKRKAGEAYLRKQKEQEEINKNKPSFTKFNVDRRRKNPEEFKKDPNKFTRDSKALYEKTYGSIGYAKGGLVRVNCGASMKPTQKKFNSAKKKK